jgi:hypothetical protein
MFSILKTFLWWFLVVPFLTYLPFGLYLLWQVFEFGFGGAGAIPDDVESRLTIGMLVVFMLNGWSMLVGGRRIWAKVKRYRIPPAMQATGTGREPDNNGPESDRPPV